MEISDTAIDPVEYVRSMRENYVSIGNLLTQTQTAGKLAEETSIRAPQEQPIAELPLPTGLREEMAAFQRDYQVASLTPVKYMRMVNGVPDLVIEDDAPLPEEQDLVTFSYTTSTVSLKAVKIVSHQVVATLAAVGGRLPAPDESPYPTTTTTLAEM